MHEMSIFRIDQKKSGYTIDNELLMGVSHLNI